MREHASLVSPKRPNHNPETIFTPIVYNRTMKRFGLLVPFVFALLGIIALFFSDSFSPRAFGLFRWVDVTYAYLTIVLPVLFALSFLVFVWKHKLTAWICVILGILLGLLRVYATHIEPFALDVRFETIKSPKVQQPIRLLHVSDIQSEKVGGYERRVFDVAADLNPDVVIYTGDYLQVPGGGDLKQEIDRLHSLMMGLSPPFGQYGTDGNVDLPPVLPGLFGGRSLMSLEDEVVEIERGDVRFRLLGVSFRHCLKDWPREMHEAVKGDRDVFTIVAAHAPECIFRIEHGDGVDLCLAGHTHGGQVVLPFLGPLVTLSGVPKKYAQGLHPYADFFLNVSAGVGVEHALGLPPIRLFCPPELVLITIEPA